MEVRRTDEADAMKRFYDQPMGVLTNGLGKHTTNHLNLTVSMADHPRKSTDFSANTDRPKLPKYERSRRIPFAGKEE